MDFKYQKNNDGRNSNAQTNSFNEGKTNALVSNIIPWRIWLKVSTSFNDPWNQLRYIKWMNKRADARTAYVPTEVGNLSSLIYLNKLIWYRRESDLRAKAGRQKLLKTDVLNVILTYGIDRLLIPTFTYHLWILYRSSNKARQLKDVLHRCDRAVIYIFIAGSYFPWLSLSNTVHSSFLFFSLKWTVWLLAALGILYQQIYHERYKCLETLLYIVMGLGPSILIITLGHEFSGMSELKIGGLMYLVGICFFKADGSIPCAHAIWHLFVVIAAAFHYYAILNYLFPNEIL